MKKDQDFKTEDYKDIKKMQESIVENSDEFTKLGLSKLSGNNKSVIFEKERLIKEIESKGKAQCNCCNSILTDLEKIKKYNPKDLKVLNSNCSVEANRIKKTVDKDTSTVCNCCGSELSLKKHELDWKKALCLVEIVKFFRHSPEAQEGQYYTKDHFFGKDQGEYAEIFKDWEDLYLYDLINRMPTHPTKIVYKDGWFGLTDNGTKFVQREVGVPKTAYTYNGEISSYDSDFTTIEKLLEEVNLNYDEIIKID